MCFIAINLNEQDYYDVYMRYINKLLAANVLTGWLNMMTHVASLITSLKKIKMGTLFRF